MDRRRFLHTIGGAAALGASRLHADGRADATFGVVGYLPWYRLKTWSAASAGPLTDLVYFGVQPTADGALPATPIDRPTLNTLRKLKQSIGCRLHLCVGGGDRSSGFAALAGQGRLRRNFAERLADLCRSAGFDGVDYDWEYPAGAEQLADYLRLVDETRKALGDGRRITVAQAPWRDFGPGIYDAVDRVHVMSYNHKHPHARLSDARADIERMLRFGCPREKLVLGVPFYGRNQRGRSRTYAELAQSMAYDTDLDVVDGFAFNNRETVREKTRYARDAQLAGIMVWEVGQDAQEEEKSLLCAIGGELSG